MTGFWVFPSDHGQLLVLPPLDGMVLWCGGGPCGWRAWRHLAEPYRVPDFMPRGARS